MNAEIISVGTEIVLGDILNTHSQFLSRELAGMGINVYYHTAVGDNDRRFTGMLENALNRSDIVFLTGGLGPTTDDITKETACQLMGLECHYDEAIGERIRSYFARSGRRMSENNKKQAMVPQGAVVLQNDWGTAPGFILEKEGKTVVLLPGPPRELQPMFLQRVKPYLEQKTNGIIFSKNVRVFGIGESLLEEEIVDLVTSGNPTVALYAKTGEVLIRVTAKAPNQQQAEELVDGMIGQLRERLGNTVYGIDVAGLNEALVAELKRQKKTVATAESCTGGMIAEQITDVPGSSEVFEMGTVTYANRIKRDLLGVSEQTLQTVGAVSRECALEMARGLAQKSGADFNVAVTGIAGPSGGTPEKPVGTVYIAVEHGGKVWCHHYYFARNQKERDYNRTQACLNAMNMVRLTLTDPKIYEEYYE
ncbi:competence damage-inducible protein A [uncultured Ruminococcus sp.]|uniref:Putative competence-damage inducible protein n=1 Tax=Massiliimalia timonensis TaxID=1987501 RepID=A0A8J6U033_9FIRM|nr:competence/damage-inducible protein A [Massiliimalia timonensis]MBC8611577.1 competence/damage-inducible protein A [Massiliimalia timonensis]SCH00015.1 competence damage-inducible protein A [uncultured Clostridium sp.]SCH95849.1 competence damage-inducible protein A [uncultured Ruminococcus sp.]